MKSLKDKIYEDLMATPMNTIGAGNPSLESDLPIPTKCKKKVKKSKKVTI